MAVIKVKPTSPGRRAVVKVSHPHLYKGRPEASLLEPQMQNAGRNNNGHITTRHKGGGHKHHYRVVDFVRNKDAIPAKVERIEYDPNRSAHIALVVLRRRRAPLRDRAARPRGRLDDRFGRRGADQGRQHAADQEHPGRLDHPLHRDAARQGRADRALGRHGVHAAGARRHVRAGAAALGRSAQDPHRLPRDDRRGRRTKSTACASYGKAGAKRWKGIRPTVRGVAMNPVDHPHGGGEGRTGEGQAPVSPWNTLTKGYRTRNNKRTQTMIVARRKK